MLVGVMPASTCQGVYPHTYMPSLHWSRRSRNRCARLPGQEEERFEVRARRPPGMGALERGRVEQAVRQP